MDLLTMRLGPPSEETHAPYQPSIGLQEPEATVTKT